MSDDKLNIGFSLEDVPDETGYQLLPAGEYEAMITSVTMESTSNGKPDYLKIEYLCQDEKGERSGKVWDNLHINYGDGTTPQNISRSRLKSLAKACDMDLSGLTNYEQFKDRSLLVEVGIRKDKTGQYSDQNVIKKVMPLFSENPTTEDKEGLPDFMK